MTKLQHHYFDLPDVRLHAVRAGDEAGETLMFLHGFPEHWYGWHRQLDFFAAAGYDVVAPDQRGYNLSSKPKVVKAYTLDKLTGDIVRLISQLGKEQVVLVGHDWGGMVAWTLAMHFPHLLRKLVILNIPHPAIMQEHLRKNPKQMLRSWYAAFFQLPLLPEQAAQAFDFKALSQAMTGTSRPHTFSEEDLAIYKEGWQQPNALTSMINWYRAFRHNPLDLSSTIEVPTLMIWGKEDTALGAEMAEPSIAFCPKGRLVFLDEATHWLHHEQPDRVNQEILTFLRNS
ncbi:alpha/beta fold hydrolase [Pontibacter sp. FD36]|uniref:alpha/beta fold hydrolase n=1 Tax=Pontibacter sp. FD36 TaxID=2789860 RepID=UPI001E4B7C59|nr:alpha/beta hydrolase [Pontibacter sp. FD36]